MVAKPRRIIPYLEPVPSGGELVAKFGTNPQTVLACAVIENAVRAMVVEYSAGMPDPRTEAGKRQRQQITQEIDNGALEFWSDVAGLDWGTVRNRLYDVARERGLL